MRVSSPERALVTITNGVLLHVMPQIASAFAVACLSAVEVDRRHPALLGTLFNLALELSGQSVDEKIAAFNSRFAGLIDSPELANSRYHTLREELISNMLPPSGVAFLLESATANGYLIATSSVLSQDSVERFMLQTPAGRVLEPFVAEPLGERREGIKLEGHLCYLQQRYPSLRRFYLLADAPSEISLGVAARTTLSIRCAGLVVPMTAAQVAEGLNGALNVALGREWSLPECVVLETAAAVSVPSEGSLTAALQRAGADAVFCYPRELPALIVDLSTY